MFHLVRRAAFILCFALWWGIPLPAQQLVPLPHDRAIRVYVGVWDRFHSPYHNKTRYLQMTANVAAYHPVEQPKVDTFDERRILSLKVPEEGGWAYFHAEGDTLKLVFRVEDTRKRLGKLRLMVFGKRLMVGEIPASADGARLAGSLRYDDEQQYYLAHLFSKRGDLLAKLLIDRGWWDAVVPLVISRQFVPYRPAPQNPERVPELRYPDYFFGDDGQWGQLKPPPRFMEERYITPRTGTLVVRDYSNDTGLATGVYPIQYPPLRRRWVLIDTLSWTNPHMRDSQMREVLQMELKYEPAGTDEGDIIRPVEVPPYSQGYAYWYITCLGEAKAMLYLPEERRRWGWNLNNLVEGIHQHLAGERDFLAQASARIANRLLKQPKWQRETGLKSGDVLPAGNRYVLYFDEPTAGYRADNLIQTFRLRVYAAYPDGNTEPMEAEVRMLHDRALVEPRPPFSPIPYSVRVEKQGVEVSLGKGWTYELHVEGYPEAKTTVYCPNESGEIHLFVHRSTKPSGAAGGGR